MKIEWHGEELRTGLTTATVYEIREGDDGWQLRVRSRICRTGEHGLAIPDWYDLGEHPTVACAIVAAQIHEDADETGRAAAAEAMRLLGWTRRVRVTRHILVHLSGSHAWQMPEDDDGYDGAAVSLMSKLQRAAGRADGSATVELTGPERAALREYVEVEEIGARENVDGFGDESSREALGELNACRGLLRQLAKIEATEAVIDRASRR